jgi:hypothetical protein
MTIGNGIAASLTLLAMTRVGITMKNWGLAVSRDTIGKISKLAEWGLVIRFDSLRFDGGQFPLQSYR